MKLTVRHLVRGLGRHRAGDRRDFPQPAFGAVITQAFRPCQPCGGDVPVALHPGAHTCSNGHITIWGDQ
ncbi:hypothetical protein [Streptomyces sp. NPDC055733]